MYVELANWVFPENLHTSSMEGIFSKTSHPK